MAARGTELSPRAQATFHCSYASGPRLGTHRRRASPAPRLDPNRGVGRRREAGIPAAARRGLVSAAGSRTTPSLPPARFFNACTWLARPDPGHVVVVEPWYALDELTPRSRLSSLPGAPRPRHRAAMRAAEHFVTRVAFIESLPPPEVDSASRPGTRTRRRSPRRPGGGGRLPPPPAQLLAGWAFRGHLELRPAAWSSTTRAPRQRPRATTASSASRRPSSARPSRPRGEGQGPMAPRGPRCKRPGVTACDRSTRPASSPDRSPSSRAAAAASGSPPRASSASSGRRSPSAGARPTSSRRRGPSCRRRAAETVHAALRHPRAGAGRRLRAGPARFGRVDVLVNNAGGQFPTPAETSRRGLGGRHPQQPERHLLHDPRGRHARHDPARRGRIVNITPMSPAASPAWRTRARRARAWRT